MDRNNTVLLSLHVKKLTLKSWVTKYLDSVPLKLKWQLSSETADSSLKDELGVLRKWESESFKLDGNQALNIDTLFLLAQTSPTNNSLTLNNIKITVSLCINNNSNVLVGTCTSNLENFRVRSKFNPHSFELMSENNIFVGYVDVFYVSQQRWVRINKASLPINNKDTEYNTSPESNVNTITTNEDTDDDTTLSCSSTINTPFSHENSIVSRDNSIVSHENTSFSNSNPDQEYVLIFWNSSNTCFVRNNPNDIQLQLLSMFIKTCLVDGDSPNSQIPFELEDIKPDHPFDIVNKFGSLAVRKISQKHAKQFFTTGNSTPNTNSSEKLNTDDSTEFDIQHSSRVYSSSVPETERLMSNVDINDPGSFYNFISRQNKQFQTLITKRILSPNSSTNTSSLIDHSTPNTNKTNNTTKNVSTTSTNTVNLNGKKRYKVDEDNVKYNSLPQYAKSIDTVASLNDITHKTTNTMTTGLVSYRNQSQASIDEEALTITTLYTHSYNADKNSNGLGDYHSNVSLRLSVLDNPSVVDNPSVSEDNPTVLDHPDVLQGNSSVSDKSEVLEDKVVEVDGEKLKVNKADLGSEIKAEVHALTSSKSSITVYSIYSPKDYIEDNFSDLTSSSEVTSSFTSISPSPKHFTSNTANLANSINLTNSVNMVNGVPIDKTSRIDNYLNHVQNAYYSPDPEYDSVNILSNYPCGVKLEVNRPLFCENSLLTFETITKDLQTIGELKSSADPELGSFDSLLIFKALRDAQALKVQGQTLPTSAYLRFFLKYLRCYNLKRVPIVVYLQIITFKQLETMKRVCSTSDDILQFINIALEALIYELQVSTNFYTSKQPENGFLFSNNLPQFNPQSPVDDYLFYEESSSVLSGDQFEIFENILCEMSKDVKTVNTRNLVYISRLNSPPVKSRGCIFRLAPLKIVLYRTFCGRRKLISNGHIIKL
uniref:Uncharacterized protein n=1 Tax=Theileria annulata TaxID=5874 RepID=A0A3B0NJQ8_THEAN